MTFSGVVLCFFVAVLAGNSVSGYSPSDGSKEKECFMTVEMVRTYVMKDSVQQFVSSVLKKGCLGVYSKDKDATDTYTHDVCDQKVKVAMSDLDNVILNKLQSKELCHLRNYTGNGIDQGAQASGPGGIVCRIAVMVAEYLLENESALLDNIIDGVCSYNPLPTFLAFLFPCKDIVRSVIDGIIGNNICPS